jgi:LuxR family maltose regulon positive regulatory protein
LIVDAAAHATAAGDVDAAVEIVATNYAAFLGQGQLATVIGWLEALPEPIAANDWLLGFAGSLVYAHAGRFDDAERWLALAQHAPPRERDGQEPEGPLAALGGYLRLLRGDVGGAIAESRRALLTPSAEDPVWALTPQMVLAPALWWGGETAEAKAVLESVTRTAQAAAIPATLVYALGSRAEIALEEDDDPLAEKLLADALHVTRHAGLADHPFAALSHIAHGLLLARQGELTGGAEEIEHGLRLGERMGAWRVIVEASLALAEVRARQRQPAEARRLLARVRDVLASLVDPGNGFERLARAEKQLRLRAAREQRSTGSPYWELSQREIDVLRLLPSSLSQREIAAALFVSFNTVRTHTRVIFEKLGVSSRADAVSRARELGLLQRG